MKGKFKKALCLLLATTMLTSSMQLTTWATELPTTSTQKNTELEQVMTTSTEQYSGTCGDNLTWTLVDGVLTISGEGEMEEYHSTRDIPWDDFREEISKLIIEEGVTSFSHMAFVYCYNLKEVQLPDSLTEIDSMAFTDCDIPIITIPKNVTMIGQQALAGCHEINVVAENTAFSSADGVLFDKLGHQLVQYPTLKDSTIYIVPESVKNIGIYAFAGSSLRHILLPAKLESIDHGAFMGCINLESFAVDEGNETFHVDEYGALYQLTSWLGQYDEDAGQWVDQYKPLYTLVKFPSASKLDQYTVPDDTSFIASYAFADSALAEITVLGNGVHSFGYNSLGIYNNAFANCKNLKNVNLPDSIIDSNNFFEYGLFFGCSALEKLRIPNGVTSIRSDTFEKCSSLSKVQIPATVTEIWSTAFNKCDSLTDIYFTGTEEQWNQVIIDEYGNDPLFSATIHFNSTMPEDDETVVTGVSLNTVSHSMKPGEILTLTATISPETAVNKNVTWSSNNEAVATVQDGIVTAIAIGEAVITVTTEDGGFTATCNVTVTTEEIKVTGISLNTSSHSMKVGDVFTLIANVAPTEATNKNVSWTSSNPSVATVADGVIRAVSAGNAIITVTTEDGGFTATCNVTVTMEEVKVSGITLNATSHSMKVGDVFTLIANVAPTEATNKNVSWTSSSPSVATVADGVIRAVSAGNAIITVTTEDGGFKATCGVAVEEVPITNKCGDNATWSLDEDGVLRINGSGAMYNYDNYDAPWNDHIKNINTIIIGRDITYIGNNAFAGTPTHAGYPNLKKLYITSESLAIGVGAFSYCNQLSQIFLSETSLNKIMTSAFDNVSSNLSVYYYYPEKNWSGWDSIIIDAGNEKLTSAKVYDASSYDAKAFDITTISEQKSNGKYEINGYIVNNLPFDINNISLRYNDGTSANVVSGSVIQKIGTLHPQKRYGPVTWEVEILRDPYDVQVHEYTINVLMDDVLIFSEASHVTVPSNNLASNEFDFDTDIWKFGNYGHNNCEISPKNYELFTAELSHTDKAFIDKYHITAGDGGHCAGLSTIAILHKMNIDLSNFITTPTLKKADKSNQNVSDLICFYQTAANCYPEYIADKQRFMSLSVKEQLKELAQKANSVKNGGCPVYLSFGNSKGGHAVVAYALERAENGKTFKSPTTGKKYNSRILIYDTNACRQPLFWIPIFSTDYCLYFNYGTDEWEVPAYAKKYNKLRACISDINVLNHFNRNTSEYNYKAEAVFNTSETIMMLDSGTGDKWTINTVTGEAMGSSELMIYTEETNTESEQNTPLHVVLPDENATYKFSTVSGSDSLDMYIRYDDKLLMLEAESIDETIFDPSGTLTITGNKGEYKLVAVDDTISGNNKHTFDVSGSNAGTTKITLNDDGLKVTGDNLNDITVLSTSDRGTDKQVIKNGGTEINIGGKEDADTSNPDVDDDSVDKPSYGYEEDDTEEDYFDTILNKIKAAKSGDTIKVNVGSKNRISVELINALKKKNNVTLVIRRNKGDNITLTSEMNFKDTKLDYYLISYLETLEDEPTSSLVSEKENPSTGAF